MKIALVGLAALLSANPVLAQTARAASPSPSSNLTRDLNSAPPGAAVPAPAPTAAPRPATAPAAPVVARPAPVVAAAPTRAPAVSVSPAPAAARPATPVTPARTPTAVPPPAAAPAPVAVVEAAPPPPPAPTVLAPAAVAALPFTATLPTGFQITTGRPGPNFNIWTVRRGDQGFVTVYAGPASQFPIYDGEMVQTGGRASVVVTEGGVRHAVEHLFQRAAAPKELHIWVASLEGGDRALAEQIAQSIDLKP